MEKQEYQNTIPKQLFRYQERGVEYIGNKNSSKLNKTILTYKKQLFIFYFNVDWAREEEAKVWSCFDQVVRYMNRDKASRCLMVGGFKVFKMLHKSCSMRFLLGGPSDDRR